MEHGFELVISCMLIWEETVYQPSFTPTSYPHHHKTFADAPSHDTLTASVACYSLIMYRDPFSYYVLLYLSLTMAEALDTLLLSFF
jgi:hypothetical protein